MRRNFAPLANAAKSIIIAGAHTQFTEDFPMSEWKVELQGEVFDISALTNVLIGTTDTIIEEEGKHYLCSSDFAAHSDVDIVRESASLILKRAYAFLKLEGIDVKPVTIGSVFRRRGKGHDVYIFPETARIWVTKFTSSGASNVVRRRNSAFLQEDIYKRNSKVRRAIDSFANDDLTYRSIYLTYEIIRDELGDGSKGADKIAVLANVEPSELLVFYENAQHERLSGDAARHAGQSRSKKQPKVDTRMPVEEARELIRKILNAWLESKSKKLSQSCTDHVNRSGRNPE